MEVLNRLLDGALPAVPSVVTIVAVVVVIMVVRAIMQKRSSASGASNFRRQLVTLLLSFGGLLVVIMVLPLSDSSRGQLLSLIGILLTAAIALSSTTFLGNIMAGFMLRAVRNFRPGDFVRVGDHFGRVSEQGLFHVEIQSEDRDLTTMPNLHMVTHPVKVIRSSGTMITAEVSLGYDDPRKKVEKLLLQAAVDAGLGEAFVYVVDLGDFSVTYRVAGLLTDVKHVLSARSRLRAKMLDALHDGGVEIVSPTFMNTRALQPQKAVVPEPVEPKYEQETVAPPPESLVFDKADEAETLEKLRERHEELRKEIKAIQKQCDDSDNLLNRDELNAQKEQLETRRERLAEYIARREEKEKDD